MMEMFHIALLLCLNLSTSYTAPLLLLPLLHQQPLMLPQQPLMLPQQPLMLPQQPLMFPQQMLPMQRLTAWQKMNALPFIMNRPQTLPLMFVPSFMANTDNIKTKHDLQTDGNGLSSHQDLDPDSVVIDADPNGRPGTKEAVKQKDPMNGKLFSIGQIISGIPWLPIEINVPDSISWAYNGISSGISSIISIIGNNPWWPGSSSGAAISPVQGMPQIFAVSPAIQGDPQAVAMPQGVSLSQIAMPQGVSMPQVVAIPQDTLTHSQMNQPVFVALPQNTPVVSEQPIQENFSQYLETIMQSLNENATQQTSHNSSVSQDNALKVLLTKLQSIRKSVINKPILVLLLNKP